MGRLNISLPPFAPDYSGACSMMFPLNSLIVIYDASGCTSNYTGFDEPRWYGSDKMVFCSGLRQLDVALGNDERYIEKICQAAEYHKPDLILFAGSPVPLVIGTDFQAIAEDIETRTHIPTIGVPTNGLNDYLSGISEVCQILLDKFLDEKEKTKARTVNLLGLTPLDFNEDTVKDLISFLEKYGWNINCILSHDLTLEKIKSITSAELNLVFNMGGVDIGEWLLKFYDMPYLAGIPIGVDDQQLYIEKMEEIIKSGNKRNFWQIEEDGRKKRKKIGIIQESVLANSLGRKLYEQFPDYEICVASPFSKTCDDYEKTTAILKSEKDIISYLQDNQFDLLIADPLIIGLTDGIKSFNYSHFAISSHFYKKYDRNIIGKSGDEIIEEIKKILN